MPNAKGHFRAFAEIVLLLTRHRELTLEMAKREMSDRYAGQVFGMLWAAGHPIFMVFLYVFIFSTVFKVKVGDSLDMPLDYTTYLLSGLVAWMSFQESMSKSCTAITSNGALVKQVVFPLEILPVKGVLVALFPQLVSLAILIIYVLFSHGSIPLTYLALPILLCFQLMAMIGIAYFLSAVGAFFRDMKEFVQLFSIAGVYLLPIFYLPSWVPSLFKPLLYLNPFSYFVWCYQDLIYFGRFEHPYAWIFVIFASITCFVLGYRVFRRLKPVLGDLL